MIYFDNAATTKPFVESLDAFRRAEEEFFPNPSSTHAIGKLSRRFVESQRQRIAEILNIDSSYYDIVFTANATQGNEIMLQSVLKRPSSDVLMSLCEHSSVGENSVILKNHGHNVFQIGCPKGFADGKAMTQKLKDNPKIGLVSVMQINNVTGSINDVYEMAQRAKRMNGGIVFHSDCVQSLNLGIIDFRRAQKSGIDAMTFSSHKSHAPKGLGLLVIRKGLDPSLSSGGGQERGVRAGTESVGLIAAYADALERIFNSHDEYARRISSVSNLFLKLLSELPSFDALRDGSGEYSDGIVALRSHKLPSEVFQRILSDEGVMVSVTSACSSNASKKNGNKLALMGYDSKTAGNTVRFSFGFENTEGEVESAICILKKISSEY
ncbi:MAG TPA: hypothetical protein DCO86_03165 [Spirochaetaceae bacterium]|nr:hypothetical protein [Spirochaetaceae bacterium]